MGRWRCAPAIYAAVCGALLELVYSVAEEMIWSAAPDGTSTRTTRRTCKTMLPKFLTGESCHLWTPPFKSVLCPHRCFAKVLTKFHCALSEVANSVGYETTATPPQPSRRRSPRVHPPSPPPPRVLWSQVSLSPFCNRQKRNIALRRVEDTWFCLNDTWSFCRQRLLFCNESQG